MKDEKLLSFLPEIRDIFLRRYEILNYLSIKGTIGRRGLSYNLKISERIIRYEIEKLKEIDLVTVSSAGVSITDKGVEQLGYFRNLFIDLVEIKTLNKEIRKLLKLKNIYVVKDNDEDISYSNLGNKAAEVLKSYLNEKEISMIGVTGGKTVASVAQGLEFSDFNDKITVIPARGSLGKSIKYQANSIASMFAMKLNCDYQMLPIPDTASKKAIEILMEDEELRIVYDKLKNLDLLVFGIGRADVMTDRRGIDEKERKDILNSGAVAEAFGHYFNINGNEVYNSQSIGIRIDDFKKIPTVIGVAGGSEKAEAIISISALRPDMVLVIDESSAKSIIDIRR